MSDNPLQNYIVTKVKQYPNGSFKDSHKKNIALEDIHFLTATGYFVTYEMNNGVPDMGSFAAPPHGSWLYVCTTPYKTSLYAQYICNKSGKDKSQSILRKIAIVDAKFQAIIKPTMEVAILLQRYRKRYGKDSKICQYIKQQAQELVLEMFSPLTSPNGKLPANVQRNPESKFLFSRQY